MQQVQLQSHGFHGNPVGKNTEWHNKVGMKAKGLSFWVFFFFVFFFYKTLR